MNKLRTLAYRFPVVFSFAVIVFFISLTEIPMNSFLVNYVNKQSAGYISGIFEQGLCGMILIFLIAGMGLLREAGFTKIKEWKQIWLAWPMIVIAGIMAWPLFNGSLVIDTSKPLLIILFLLLFLSTGFFEEVLCRGFVTTFLIQGWGSTKKGIYGAVLISSLLFGMVHIANFLLGRYSLSAAATQMIYAIFAGVFLSACMLRNNSIWPVIIIHGLVNASGSLSEIAVGGSFGQFYEPTLVDSLSSIVIFLPLFVYGMFILRKVKPINQPLNDDYRSKTIPSTIKTN